MKNLKVEWLEASTLFYFYKTMLRGIIYKYTNIHNNKVYIGQTTNEYKRRERWHCPNSEYAGAYINRARAKYGIASFIYEVLEEIFETSKEKLRDKLDFLEEKYIKLYNSKNEDYGYNLTDGGRYGNGQVITEETRRNMSKAQKGLKKPMSERGKKNISAAHKGPRPWTWKKVCQYDKNTGELIKIWNSMTEAVASFGEKHVGNLAATIRGKHRRKYYKGYKWAYYETTVNS